MGDDFSFSDFDQTLELYTTTCQFPSSASTPLTRAKSRVSLACIPCRSRHTKCDATVPACSQCLASSRTCSYAESRRGRAKGGRLEHRQQSLREHEQSEIEGPLQGRTQQSRPGSNDASSGNTSDGPVDLSVATQTNDNPSSSMSEPDESSTFLDVYYASFHDAHPFVLPRQFLNQRLQTNKFSLQHLLPVMEFVGSLFAPGAAKGMLRVRAESALSSDHLPATGFTVQSLLIFAIAVHACNEFVRARGILDHAIRIALQINMNSNSFSIANGEGCSVLEESWRRTWWSLYVTDGLFAAIRHCLTFSLRDIKADVDLPCEEATYQSGDIPQPRTLEEYYTREFAGEELIFSSFAYLIDLGHILGSLLALGTEPGEPFEPAVISADASLMNWALYLPKQKHLVVEDPGKVDEVLFQAHSLHSTLKVYLHRPRSQLAYDPIERTSKCAPPPSDKSVAERQRAYDFHTTKVLEAAEAGIGLFTLPSPFTKHTPMVICGLTLAILAQVSACRFKLKGPGYTAARDRVRLGLAAIKAMGEVWTIGSITVKDLQIIARETLSL
ncbi:hypothetical protein V1506DRAFT_461529 [Lipomyces tetrasporus]